MLATALVVEDDPKISQLLSAILGSLNYGVDITVNGDGILGGAIPNSYALIIIDLTNIHLDGVALCRRLRQGGYLDPLVVLADESTQSDIVAGLDAGADDYITKPCITEVIQAKLRALLRRHKPQVQVQPGLETVAEVSLTLNPEAATATYQGKTVALTPKEFDIVDYFLQHPDQVFSRTDIIAALWTENKTPSEGAITNLIKDLRRKFTAAGIADSPIETVYGVGYRLRSGLGVPVEESLVPAPSYDLAGITSVTQTIQQYQSSFLQGIDILESAAAALAEERLSADLRNRARAEAHKLAGGLGTFGSPLGSVIAKTVERILSGQTPLTWQGATQLTRLIQDMRTEVTALENRTVTAVEGRTHARPLVLVVDDDDELTEQLQIEALDRGLLVDIAPNPETCLDKLTQHLPDIILLDLMFPAPSDDGLVLLQQLRDKYPTLPIFLFTVRDTLPDRVAAARLGTKGYLRKPLSPKQVFESLLQALGTQQPIVGRVMLMDDDPAVSSQLTLMLQQHNLEVTYLQQPEEFWQTLTQMRPDVLLLDLGLPTYSGLDLCRVVRQDQTWGKLPIIIVTALTDTETVQQAFAAGADGFVGKPVDGPTLSAQVLNCVERSQRQQQLDTVQQQEHQNLHRQAILDGLTGIANRRCFDDYLELEWRRLSREVAPLSLIMGDVDDFKRYNDLYGHPMGDRCLQEIAAAISRVVRRPADLVARYGGEEFAIILPNTTLGGAVYLAEQIQQSIQGLKIAHAASSVSNYVTISLGIASVVPRNDCFVSQLIQTADEALYAAKSQGRNRMCSRTLI